MHYDLESATDSFTYDTFFYVPADATTVTMTDTLEDVSTFVGGTEGVSVTYNDSEIAEAQVSIDGQTLTVKLADEAAIAHRTHRLTISFDAQIKDGADLSPYATTGTVLVPNKASCSINNKAEVESLPVTVTPPGEEEFDKTVNGSKRAELQAFTKQFDYRIVAAVPADAEKLVISDTLEPVLELVGDVVVSDANGGELDSYELSVDGSTITVTLAGEAAISMRTRHVVVSFAAKIAADADLSSYTNTEGIEIPTAATLAINNQPEVTSEPATVVPPVPFHEIEKTVNKKAHEDLKTSDESFTYEIAVFVPEDANKVAIYDTLVDELEFVSAAKDVRLVDEEGTNIGGAKVVIKGKALSVTLEKDLAVA